MSAQVAGDRDDEASRWRPRDGATALEVRARIPARFAQALEKALEDDQPVQATSEDQRFRLTLTGFAGESDTRGPLGLFRLREDQAGLRPGDMVPLVVLRPGVVQTLAKFWLQEFLNNSNNNYYNNNI